MKVDTECHDFVIEHYHISPMDLELILEWLQDRNYLGYDGRKFHHKFWETYVKQSEDEDRNITN